MRTARLRQSIETRIRHLVLVCVVPAWLVAIGVAIFAYQREREDLVEVNAARAAALISQLEREVALGDRVLRTLANESSIDRRDFAGFHERARQAMQLAQADDIVWFDSPRSVLLSAAYPLGHPLPPALVDRFPGLFENGHTALSDLFTGQMKGKSQVALAVPVLRGGRVVGRLDMVVTSERFERLIERQRFPEGWLSALVDRGAQVVARYPHRPFTSGSSATAEIVPLVQRSDSGHKISKLPDGTRALASFSRSKAFGWTAIVWVPMADLNRALIQRLGAIAVFAVLFLLGGLLLARRLGRKISAPVMGLVEPALAIGRGEDAPLPALDGLRETSELIVALEQARRLLQEREQSRKQAEADLRDSQMRLQLALDIARIGTWEFDVQTKEIQHSRRHDECFGYAEPPPRWTIHDFIAHVHPDDRERVVREMNRFDPWQDWRSDLSECRVVWPDGSVHWISFGSVSATEPGRRRRIIGITKDITSEKEAELQKLEQVRLEAETRQAREASRQKSDFLARMSHELRTPLNAVIGFAELLCTPSLPPDSPKRIEFVGHIAAAGRHLLQLINDLLDLEKAESGRFQFAPQEVDLPSLCEEVLGVIRVEAERKQIQTRVEVGPGVGKVQLDPARLKQVLYNFLSNALKFTPENGTVVLRAQAVGNERVRLEVEDSGVGIAEEEQQKLFTPFHQLSSGVQHGQPGTGLGLAISRQLVELQGGCVEVKSAHGQGSVFAIVLPVRQAR